MDRWIALHEGATGPKLRLFAALADCSESEALGVLCQIWIWGRRDNVTSSGLMKNTSVEHIKNIFSGTITEGVDPQRVVDALIESEWIDEIEGSYYIHDWPEHQAPLVKYQGEKEANKMRKRNQRLRKRQLEADPDTGPDDEPEVPPPKAPVDSPGGTPPDKSTETPAKPGGNQYTSAFEAFWAVYPRKDEKANAYKKYQARLNDGFSDEELLTAAKAYAERCKRLKTERHYIKLGKTFLSDSTPFTDFLRKDDHSGFLSADGHGRGLDYYDPGDTEGSL